MAKDPAVLFYTSDFLTGTMTMSNEQVGKYIRLLCLQHQKGILYENDMLFICGSYDKDIFDKFVKEGQTYCNERLRIESEKRASYSQSRSNNRTKGIDNKKLKKKKSKLSYDNHMENENEIIDENKKVIKNNKEEGEFEILEPYPFNEFWDMYDKKVGRADCFKKFTKTTIEERVLIWEHLPDYIKSTPNKQYRKDPETYINGKHWNDEIIIENKNGKQQLNTEAVASVTRELFKKQ